MLYVDYEMFKRRYIETQRKFDAILSEKEELFARTQPKAVRFDKDRVLTSIKGNVFEDYVTAKEERQLDERLREVKALLDDRARLLKLKEQELRSSKEILDKIYCAAYIDRVRVFRIARRLNYSERQIYRFLSEIDERLKDGTKCQENGAMIVE